MKEPLQNKKQINESLKIRLSELLPEQGKFPTAIDDLYLCRWNGDVRIDCFNNPCVGVIVQGNKRSVIAGKEYRYTEGDYIAPGTVSPSIGYIIGASPEKPHLAVALPLDRRALSQLAKEIKLAPKNKMYKGVTVGDASVELLEAVLRLLRLLDVPERIPVFAPMLIREIYYYLLAGPQGEDFWRLGTAETPDNRIACVIGWLRENYKERIRTEALAAQANMSVSAFSRHFHRIIGMSPLQFQKQVRLYEAQLLMLAANANVEDAALAVGYGSATQFNREYKRHFGEPPHRNIKRLRASVAVVGGDMLARL
jgi:AraC-like DNA-binding protein